LLHAALLHVTRRGQREAILWNIAADIIVNGLIAEQNVFTLPSDALREPKWEKLSVEEIYTLLMQQENHPQLPNFDLLSQPPEDAQGNGDGNFNLSLDDNFSSLSQAQREALATHWKNALQQATLIARSTNQGNLPAGLERQLKELSQAQLDWRTYLWRYLVQTPTDFQGFDRRFVGRGLYLDTIAGESVQVFVAVDTSGSIGEQELKLFLSEVQGILGAYPHLKCILYYTDAEAYGPYSLTSDSSIPQPVGGGGTSFVPFFNKVESIRDFDTQGVCVYLTDGYGTFPTDIPNLPVLWVVTPGGLDLEQFPFGEAVRLLNHF
jgi:predicted metal-dependent peptidase